MTESNVIKIETSEERAARWLRLNEERGLSYSEIAVAENARRPARKITVSMIAGAINRYRKQQNLGERPADLQTGIRPPRTKTVRRRLGEGGPFTPTETMPDFE